MMNSQSTQPIQTIDPQLPLPNLPQVPVDPANPLSWIILLTLFFSTTGKTIDAAAKLVRSIAALRVVMAKARQPASKKDASSHSSKQD